MTPNPRLNALLEKHLNYSEEGTALVAKVVGYATATLGFVVLTPIAGLGYVSKHAGKVWTSAKTKGAQ
jgi:hypothetical protein